VVGSAIVERIAAASGSGKTSAAIAAEVHKFVAELSAGVRETRRERVN